MEKQVALAYPTPIGRFRLPDAEAVNRGLKRAILDKERTEASDDYANVGGWHSRHDVLEWPLPEVGVLRGWILEALNHMVAASAPNKALHGTFAAIAWAN